MDYHINISFTLPKGQKQGKELRQWFNKRRIKRWGWYYSTMTKKGERYTITDAHVHALNHVVVYLRNMFNIKHLEIDVGKRMLEPGGLGPELATLATMAYE